VLLHEDSSERRQRSKAADSSGRDFILRLGRCELHRWRTQINCPEESSTAGNAAMHRSARFLPQQNDSLLPERDQGRQRKAPEVENSGVHT
jgi:hypothetical protein